MGKKRAKELSYAERATKYAQDVAKGRVRAGLGVRLACARHLADLERQKDASWPYAWEPEKGNRICRFAENMVHIKGKWAGQLIRLEDWQCFVLAVPFGWARKSDGLRRFREVYGEIPRKNGKSMLGAIVGLYLSFADSEPGAEVYSGATTLEQALEVFRPAWMMVDKNPEFRGHFGLELGGTSKNPGPIYCMKDGSRFAPVVGQPGDGASPHGAIVDEYHEHPTPDLYDTMKTGMGARLQPMMVVITTAGVDTSAPCFEHRGRVLDVLKGTVTNEELFGIIFGVDDVGYKIVFQSYKEIVKRLEGFCTCGLVPITQIENQSGEDYASSATIRHGEKTVPNGEVPDIIDQKSVVSTTPTDPRDQGDCVHPVMSSLCSMQTQIENSEPSPEVLNGQRTTQKNEGMPLKGGEKTEDVTAYTQGHSQKNTGYQSLSMSGLWQSKMELAQSVGKDPRGSALTIATTQGVSGDYFAVSATQRSDSLEILKKAYFAHSPTCKVRKLKVDEADLSITVPPDDWKDFEVWRKANPNLGVSVFEDYLRGQHRDALQSASKQNILLTKHLNKWMNAGRAWMNMAKWEACARPGMRLEDFRGRRAWVSLDLASKVDIAAAVAVIEDGDGWAMLCKAYLPEATVELPHNAHYRAWAAQGFLTVTDGARTDFQRIEDDLREWSEVLAVQELPFDPREASYLIQQIQTWASFECVEVPQAPAHMSEPMKELEGLVAAGKLAHPDDPVFNWMMGNVVLKQARGGGPVKYFYPAKEREAAKIDGPVALIMALKRALAGGGNEPSIYENAELWAGGVS